MVAIRENKARFTEQEIQTLKEMQTVVMAMFNKAVKNEKLVRNYESNDWASITARASAENAVVNAAGTYAQITHILRENDPAR